MANSDKDREDRHTSGGGGADRLRDDIDRGGSGDKVAFRDPSAAPLGTDDEAGGNPPTQRQVETAREQETRRSDTEGAKLTPSDLQSGSRTQKFGVGLVVLIAAVCLIALLVFFY